MALVPMKASLPLQQLTDQIFLDPALLRPGRFDRQVVVGRPDLHGREAILKGSCARNKTISR